MKTYINIMYMNIRRAALTVKSGVKAAFKPGLVLASLLLFSCGTTPPGPTLVQLPVLDASVAAKLNFKSIVNPSPIKHHHVLSLDGQKIAKLEESDKASFLIEPGAHTLSLTCHTRNTRDTGGFPVNYNVSDGDDSMDINVAAGDEMCFKITFKILKCAVIEDADPSFCQR